ncbi:hypothetical protein ACHAXA_000411 [Cyclostephanos tholiformis]|uniref:Bromo domain-containing protein n=1 Tax=Cyclostephanos tholiformis TaxID=382380 RepID=A0ABD3RGN6_9STRA
MAPAVWVVLRYFSPGGLAIARDFSPQIVGASLTSSIIASTSSLSQQYSHGANFVPELSFKVKSDTSGDSKSITPEKDVTMDDNNDEVSSSASAANSPEEEKGGRREGGSGGIKGEEEGEEDDDDAAATPTNPMDLFMEAVELRTGERATDEKSGGGEIAGGGGEKNGNGEEKDADDTSGGKDVASAKKIKLMTEVNGGENEGEPAAPPVVNSDPLLKGVLAYSDRDNLRRHVIRGSWQYETPAAGPPERFELIRNIPPEEDLKELPKDGEFNGSFNVVFAVKNQKGKIRNKTRAVTESGVKLTFKPRDESKEIFDVNGFGLNEFGTFELYGTAKRNPSVVEEDPTYFISVHKRYVIITPAPTPDLPAAGTAIVNDAESKDKKRKHDAVEDDEATPPPIVLPPEGVTLHGKLVRNTSEELSLDNTAVHRVTGLWSMMGLSFILDNPNKCEKFEFEHKCSGDSTVFPLSGRYTGFFYVSDEPEGRTKVAERDVTLKFILNRDGYYNVEGRGSNVYGKYSITGLLMNDNTITLCRHFQAIKLKASRKLANVKQSDTGEGSNGSAILPDSEVETAMSVVQTSSTHLTFNDVKLPNCDEIPPPLEAPEQYTATSRGILKIEPDGTHTCSGSWALSNDHYSNGVTSKYHFGIAAHNAVDDAKAMLELGLVKGDDRQIKNLNNANGISPVTLAHSTFPIDSTNYKGSFKLRKGSTRTQTIIDHQIVLKYLKNSGGSYNVYGKGVNEMGTFDLTGTLILQGNGNGLMQLYRTYPVVLAEPVPFAQQPTGSKKSSKVFRGGLTEKATPANSGPAPAMKPPERFTPSASGLLRRESSRTLKPPSRLEEDDPQAQMNRCMEKCRKILQELNDGDVQNIFGSPVDPIALGVPTYFDVIKEPMDLGTIKTMMDSGEIDSPAEFSRLVRLTFENAITFNTLPDNIVHVTARNLLATFTKKFGTIDKIFDSARKNKTLSKAERLELRRKEKELMKDAKRKEKREKELKRKAEAEASNESKRMKLENVIATNKSTMAAIAQAAPDDPDAVITRSEYNLLVQAIKDVQSQIVGLHKLVRKSQKSTTLSSDVDYMDTAPPYESSYEPSYSASETYSQLPKPKKKKNHSEAEPSSFSPPPSPKTFPTQAPGVEILMPLSIEEQEALSEAINLLPEKLLPGAMQIIREADFVNDDDDEIDLDIDQLDTRTQRKLQSFVMENVKTKKKKKPSKKQKAPVPVAALPSPYPIPEVTAKLSTNSRPPGGKSFFALGDDIDSDDDKDEEEEDDLKVDFATNWIANPTKDSAAEKKATSDDDSDGDDDEDDLWGAARKETEASKAREADRAKREEKMRAEAELAAKKRMAEAQELGEQARAKRLEEEAAEARLKDEQEHEAKEASKAAREQAIKSVEGMEQTVDLDATRVLMEKYDREFNNDNYSAGASPGSDFGF